MLAIAKADHVDDVKALFQRWELHCEPIGTVTSGNEVVIMDGGVEVARVPVGIATEPPQYRREGVRPAELAELNAFNLAGLPDLAPEDATSMLLRLLALPNISSRRGVYRTYDHQVLNNTVVSPGGDAGVVRVMGTEKGIALATDCSGRLCYLDPYTGAAAAVAEAARNVVCTGAVPVAVTDCLNFGNPEKLEVYYQLEQCVRGIAEACSMFGTPVVSGNVSLYNESAGRSIYPTPVIGMMGILEDVSKHLAAGFGPAGSSVYLLGAGLEQPAESLAGSEYLEAVHGKVAGLPRVDLHGEHRLQQLVLRAHGEGLLASAHDCSDGGLAVTLAECSILGGRGFEGSVAIDGRLDAALFGEAQGRIVVSLLPDSFRQGGGAARLEDLARELGVPVKRLGATVGGGSFAFGPVSTTVTELNEAYETPI
jgi:phosphoribosylformylglycinamidine synthase II